MMILRSCAYESIPMGPVDACLVLVCEVSRKLVKVDLVIISFCKAENRTLSVPPLHGERREVTRVDGFQLGETLHSKERLKPTRSNLTQCKTGF